LGAAAAADPLPAPQAATAIAELEMQRYLYVEFPRQIQAINDETALAERHVAFLKQRVDGYQPFRSFHQYAATYTADQLAQLELLAAQQAAARLRHHKADLWRERQMAVQLMLLRMSLSPHR
jgi:hypothetical protein